MIELLEVLEVLGKKLKYLVRNWNTWKLEVWESLRNWIEKVGRVD